jgi:hypothetical protein
MLKAVTTMSILVLATSFASVMAQEQPETLKHYVFFGRDRERINEPSFLDSPAFAGAQLKYTWKELEPEKDKYDTDLIEGDLAILQAHGKRLFIQLQDISFSTQIVNVPEYLQEDPVYNGGAHIQYEVEDEQDEQVTPIGWVARRWDPAVLDRFSKLLQALGKTLDGKIEGINFAETSVGFGHTGEYFPEGFTFETYRDGIKSMMKAGRDAFPTSTVIVYANFMPGEWIPWNDQWLPQEHLRLREEDRCRRWRPGPDAASQGTAQQQLPADSRPRPERAGRRCGPMGQLRPARTGHGSENHGQGDPSFWTRLPSPGLHFLVHTGTVLLQGRDPVPREPTRIATHGVYQTGEVYARSWIVAGTLSGRSIPKNAAS